MCSPKQSLGSRQHCSFYSQYRHLSSFENDEIEDHTSVEYSPPLSFYSLLTREMLGEARVFSNQLASSVSFWFVLKLHTAWHPRQVQKSGLELSLTTRRRFSEAIGDKESSKPPSIRKRTMRLLHSAVSRPRLSPLKKVLPFIVIFL